MALGAAAPEAACAPSRSSRSLVANVLNLAAKPAATPKGPPGGPPLAYVACSIARAPAHRAG
jgi:hypothetical protein